MFTTNTHGVSVELCVFALSTCASHSCFATPCRPVGQDALRFTQSLEVFRFQPGLASRRRRRGEGDTLSGTPPCLTDARMSKIHISIGRNEPGTLGPRVSASLPPRRGTTVETRKRLPIWCAAHWMRSNMEVTVDTFSTQCCNLKVRTKETDKSTPFAMQTSGSDGMNIMRGTRTATKHVVQILAASRVSWRRTVNLIGF